MCFFIFLLSEVVDFEGNFKTFSDEGGKGPCKQLIVMHICQHKLEKCEFGLFSSAFVLVFCYITSLGVILQF